MSDNPDGKLLSYPTGLVNAVAAAEKAAELVQEASERFLEELDSEYRRQVRGEKKPRKSEKIQGNTGKLI